MSTSTSYGASMIGNALSGVERMAQYRSMSTRQTASLGMRARLQLTNRIRPCPSLVLNSSSDSLSTSGVRQAQRTQSSSKGSGSTESTDKKPSTSSSNKTNNANDDSSSTVPTSAKLTASLGIIIGGLIVLVVGGVLMKDQIAAFLDLFIHLVDRWGPLGYVAYMAVYAGLELLAVPAIPLTMTAGAIFGIIPGTMVVSVSATAAATGAFLIARYVARDKVASWAETNPKFKAIDRAIGKNGFKVVTLLRLSPLLPLAASNYLYGLTSVELSSYVLGSWLGMLPGTFAYVTAGTYGKELLNGGGLEAAGLEWWQVGAALGATVVALTYVGKIATEALQEYDQDIGKGDGGGGLH